MVAVPDMATNDPFEYELMQMQRIRVTRGSVVQPFAAVHGEKSLEYWVR